VRAKSELVDLGHGGADGGSDWRSAEQLRALVVERAHQRRSAQGGGLAAAPACTDVERVEELARARVSRRRRRAAPHALLALATAVPSA